MNAKLSKCLDELSLIIDESGTTPEGLVQRDALTWAVRGCLESYGLDPNGPSVYGTIYSLSVAIAAMAGNPTVTMVNLAPLLAVTADHFHRYPPVNVGGLSEEL